MKKEVPRTTNERRYSFEAHAKKTTVRKENNEQRVSVSIVLQPQLTRSLTHQRRKDEVVPSCHFAAISPKKLGRSRGVCHSQGQSAFSLCSNSIGQDYFLARESGPESFSHKKDESSSSCRFPLLVTVCLSVCLVHQEYIYIYIQG